MSYNLTVDIIATAFNKITKNLQNGMISLGTRDPMIYFLAEIEKNCKDSSSNHEACIHLELNDLEKLKKLIDNTIATSKSLDIRTVYNTLKLTKKEDQNVFAQTVFKVIADFALNTDGKNENAYRAAILPINKTLNTIELPGSEIEAFGGFASEKARNYSFSFARLSTLISLKESVGGFRPNKPFIASDNFPNFEKKLTDQIEEIDFFNNKGTYASALEQNLFNPSVTRLKGVLLSNKYLKFILLKIPFVATSLLGTIAMPIVSAGLFVSSIFKKSPWRGSNILKNLIRKGVDQINYMPLEPVTISILSDIQLNKKLMFRCADDTIKKGKTIEHVIKTSGNKKRYQYYFQVSLLEYIKQQNTLRTNATSQNADFLKIDSLEIDRLGLSLSDKVQMPNDIDGNLYPKRKRIAIENNYKDIIIEMRIR